MPRAAQLKFKTAFQILDFRRPTLLNSLQEGREVSGEWPTLLKSPGGASRGLLFIQEVGEGDGPLSPNHPIFSAGEA